MTFRTFIMSIALCFGITSTAIALDVTAIKAGHIIMPETGEVLDNKIILINGRTITDIVDTMPKEGITNVIDLSDQWVLPGLMDMHTHLSAIINDDGNIGGDSGLNKSNATRALMGAQMAKEMLYGGFTTVREVGNSADYVDTALREAIERRRIEGPRIINSGKIISIFGGQTHGISFENSGFWEREYIDVVSPDDMRRAIHKNIYFGARMIKLVVGDHPYSLSDETLKAAVDEAKSAGMTIAIHAWGDQQVARATRAGATSIEHGPFASEETLKLMKDKGVFLVGTEFPARYLEIFWGNKNAAENMAASSIEQMKKAYKVGAPMAFGTDIIMRYENETRDVMALNYLDMWTAANIPPAYIIKAMTINGAKVLGMEAQLGSIEKGKIADIIAVPSNPLDDIYALQKVSFVMQSGRKIR